MMTPLQAELHRAHLARQARMAEAAARHAQIAKARAEAMNIEAAVTEPEPIKIATEDRDWLIVTPRVPSTIKDIQRVVAGHYGFTRHDLISVHRAAPLAKARHVAMYIAKSITPWSLPQIGRHFGNRDHTTVISAVRKVGRLIEADEAFRAEVNGLKTQFEAAQ